MPTLSTQEMAYTYASEADILNMDLLGKTAAQWENTLAKTVDKIVRIEYNNSTEKGNGSMSITATELKNNLGKYLSLSATEDVFITKNGKVVAKLTNPYQDRVEVAKSLFGILPKDADLDTARTERFSGKDK